jgi:hypothetical protein
VLVVVCAGSALAAPARPDLVAAAIAVSQQGTTLSVNDVVRNNGGATARRSTAVYTVGGVRIGARSVPPLRVGATSRASVRLVVPASVAPGSYRLVVCVDGSHRVAEANERNNCRPSTRRIDVTDRTAPVFAGLTSAVTCIPGPAGGPTRMTSYRLTWSAASDDVTPASALVYDIYVANAPGAEDFSIPAYTTAAGATTFSTPPLPDDRSYYFVVRARDQAGNRDRGSVERMGSNLCL